MLRSTRKPCANPSECATGTGSAREAEGASSATPNIAQMNDALVAVRVAVHTLISGYQREDGVNTPPAHPASP